jgi:hypothetical protein
MCEKKKEDDQEEGKTHRSCHSFESSMRMLRESRNAIAMIHSVGLVRIEVSPISLSWGTHIFISYKPIMRNCGPLG